MDFGAGEVLERFWGRLGLESSRTDNSDSESSLACDGAAFGALDAIGSLASSESFSEASERLSGFEDGVETAALELSLSSLSSDGVSSLFCFLRG